jgi:hypothetical protein
VKATIPSSHWCWKFGIFKVFCEGFSFRIKSTAENIQRNSHAMQYRSDCSKEVAKPTDHGEYPVVKNTSVKRTNTQMCENQ